MKNKLFKQYLLFISLVLLSTSQLIAQGFLKRSGRNIKNDNGNILLKGTNLGNWLMQEGYLMDAGSQSHTEFWNEIASLTGSTQKAITLREEWMKNYITKADIDTIAAAGYNSVRVPFHYNLFYNESTQQLTNDGFKYIDDLLVWCAEFKIYVILDMHAAPGGQNWAHHGDGNGNAALWSNYTANKAKSVKIWEHIATKYKNNPWVGGYDLLNEPDMAGGDEWKLRDYYVAVTAAIRAKGDNHLVFAEGKNFAVFLGLLQPTWDNNMAFSIHNYWEDFDPPHWGDQLWEAQNANIPLWLGEFGENSNNWNNEMITLSEKNNVGWAVWNYKKVGSMSNSMGVRWSEGYWNIKEYLRGNGNKPSQNDAYNDFLYFIKEANTTSGSLCYHHLDFDDALLRPDFKTKAIPYKDQSISSYNEIKIKAWEYDMGSNNIAYNDKVFEKTCKDCGAWNDGWTIRCDGADIKRDWIWRPDWNQWNWDTLMYNFKSTDNEWVSYTINFNSSGEHNFTFNMATGTTSTIRMEINGQSYTQTVQKSGWSNFNDVNFNNINISAGSRQLKLYVATGSVDFKFLTVRSNTYSPLRADFSASRTTGCLDKITFTNTSAGTPPETTYQWNFGNGATPSAATGKGPHEVSYSIPGKKNILLSLNNGESVETKLAYLNLTDCISGTLDNTQSLPFNIYPMPFNNTLTVEGTTEINAIELYNIKGELIYNKTSSKVIDTINLQELKSGLYLIKIQSGDNYWTKQIIKK